MLRSLALATTFLLASLGFARAQQVEPDKFPPMVCAYNASLPSIAAGSFGLLQCDAQGRIIISNPGGGGGGGGNAATTSNGTDAQPTSATNQQNVTYNYLFNGTTWDRMRGTGGSANVNVQNFPASQPVTGTFFQSVQPVSGTVTANQGAAAALANAWPTYLSQGGTALSTTNGLPTTDTNAAQSFTAPGTSATKAQAVQGVSGGIAVPVSGTVTANQGGAPWAVSWTGQTVAATQSGAWNVGLSAGTNAIGSITNTSFASTVASGANVTEGTAADTAYAGTGSATIVAALKGIYAVGAGPTPAGTNTIGSISNITGTISLPTGAATAANQNSTAAGTSATNAQAVQGVTNGVPLPSNLYVGGAVAVRGTNPVPTVSTGSANYADGAAPTAIPSTSGVTFKGGSGNLFGINVVAGATAGFIVAINATAVPTSGAAITPTWAMPLAASTGFSGAPTGSDIPMGFSTGITLLFSSSLTTYTPVTASLLGATVR